MKAVATVNNAVLERVWQGLDYRLDVCLVTNGAHIGHSLENLRPQAFRILYVKRVIICLIIF